MTPQTPNMRELSEFASRYAQKKDRSAVDEIARAFGLNPEDLRPSWRAVIAAAIDAQERLRGPRGR
jgi:hypothetical protein